jgi:hypothetical protein
MNVDKGKGYNCGERVRYDFGSPYEDYPTISKNAEEH